jgi:branched-chain amino acid transport system permease protein
MTAPSARSSLLRSPRAREAAYLAGLAAAGAVLPFVIYPIFAMKILYFALFACAYNLLFGYLGMLAFGHAAFFGFASYVCAHAVTAAGLTPELGILGGTVAAGLLGAVIGALAIRRTGLYFAMITLALAQIVYFYLVQAPWSMGEDGIQTGPRGKLFGVISLADNGAMYTVTLVIFLFGFAVVNRAVNSPFGEVLTAIRDNEARAISLGYDTRRFKLLAFVLSAALSGLAGSTKAVVLQLANLSDVHFATSGEVLLMVLIGGIGTTLGPVVGAAVLVSMFDALARTGAWVQVIQGVLFVSFVLLLRSGIVGTLAAAVGSWRNRPAR